MELKILTYNMHKGRSFWFRDYRIGDIRKQVSKIKPDILFLQEIPGLHPDIFSHALNPIEYFAEHCGGHHCYGQNAVYKKGHHGNAIVSQFPILHFENHNISQTRFAVRGLLHAQIESNSSPKTKIHLLNAHLDLLETARHSQAHFILDYVKSAIPFDEPVILAGDFNDWRKRLDIILEPYLTRARQGARKLHTSPSVLPIYDLDRVYYRNLKVVETRVETHPAWRRLSDHLPLACTLVADHRNA